MMKRILSWLQARWENVERRTRRVCVCILALILAGGLFLGGCWLAVSLVLDTVLAGGMLWLAGLRM
ncbi:hypothetical protein [Desulfocurvus sp. DL9XJH121]